MLKEIDGKIVVPERFMEWLAETGESKSKDNSYQITLINRTGWGFGLGIDLSCNDETYSDLTSFSNVNTEQLTRALLDKKEFISEEEKKYYMVAPKGFNCKNKYLNRFISSGKYIMDNSIETILLKTKFTQSEIDAMPQKFRDFFEKVEVEE